MTGKQVGFMNPTTLDEAMKCAELMASSNMVPKNYQDKAGDILIAGQMGAELGVPWLQALQGICVINGNPSVWGDLAWALVTGHPKFEDFKEWYDEETRTAHCHIKVKGRETMVEQSFSYADACQAGLNTKDTYQKYRRRMLQWRARSWAMRDAIPEALKGLKMAEEQIAIEGAYTVVTDEDAKSTGMEGLSKAMATPALAGPVASGKHPEGSAEWWAELIAGCTSHAMLEKCGFELRSADPELHSDLRGAYEKHWDSLKGTPAMMDLATGEIVPDGEGPAIHSNTDETAIRKQLDANDDHVEQEYEASGSVP
jgi:hypothetical protein